jgi:hypothetical protein
MSEPLPILVENSVQIAWDFLERSGEISNAGEASQFLVRTVAELVRNGERRRLKLSNQAIDAYRRHTSRFRLVS